MMHGHTYIKLSLAVNIRIFSGVTSYNLVDSFYQTTRCHIQEAAVIIWTDVKKANMFYVIVRLRYLRFHAFECPSISHLIKRRKIKTKCKFASAPYVSANTVAVHIKRNEMLLQVWLYPVVWSFLLASPPIISSTPFDPKETICSCNWVEKSEMNMGFFYTGIYFFVRFILIAGCEPFWLVYKAPH